MSPQRLKIHIRPRVILLLLTLGFATTAIDSPAIAKGTDWHIDFGDGSASADGTVTFTFKMNQGTEKSVTLNVEEGWGPDYKAGRLNDLIDPTDELKSHVESNPHKVWVETDDSWEDDDRITELTHEDTGTGEGITHHSDDAPAGTEIIVATIVNIEGIGTGGTLGLGIGSDLDGLVSIDTGGKTGSDIEQELLDAFNLAYVGLYVATLDNGQIIIPNIPCPLGVLFGTTDTGLSYSFTMRQTGTVSIPALTGWGALILLAVTVIAAVIVIRRRHRVLA
jgi:hypothetical protein